VATSSVTYTFTALTKAQAAQVNQNFTNLVTFLNTDVVHVDGSKSMTGALTLPNSDPTNANHAARKSYVDAAVASTGWTSYTPTWTQGATISKTVSYSKYVQIGKTVIWTFELNASSAGTAGQPQNLTLPVTAASQTSVQGTFRFLDSLVGYYVGHARGASLTTVQFWRDQGGLAFGDDSSLDPTVANNDVLSGFVTYEAA
jgi:hypothetical protein